MTPAFAGAGLFRKPVPTPDQDRGRLFRDHALGVESQYVVLGQSEFADWCSIFDAGVWPVPIVAMQPVRQLVFSLARVFIGLGVGPFAQAGLDVSLDLASCVGWVG